MAHISQFSQCCRSQHKFDFGSSSPSGTLSWQFERDFASFVVCLLAAFAFAVFASLAATPFLYAAVTCAQPVAGAALCRRAAVFSHRGPHCQPRR